MVNARKGVAAFIAVVFSSTNVLFAHRFLDTSQPAHPANLTLVATAPFGSIRKTSHPKNKKSSRTVIHVQDVHMNPEAQANIGGFIQNLVREKKAGMVLLEGAFAPVDFSSFRDFPYADATKAVADYLLREKRISGAVHAGYLLRGENTAFTGIDDRQHYNANVRAYQTAAPLIDSHKQRWDIAKLELEHEKTAVLNVRLAQFEDDTRLFHDREISFGQYVRILTDASNDISIDLRSFYEVLDQEKKIDFVKVERERAALISGITAKISRAASLELLKWSTDHRDGAMSHAEFYGRLKTLCQRNGVDLRRYATLDDYIRYVRLSELLNIEKIFADAGKLEADIADSLCKNPREQEWLSKYRRLRLAGKLLDFSLTRREWDEYLETNAAAQLPGCDLSAFEDFYREAEARDRAMADNALRAISQTPEGSTTVLVAGGFHAPGLEKLLLAAGINVVAFVPRVTQIDTKSGSQYLGAFTQRKTPLDKLFSGEKLFIPTVVAAEPKPVQTLVLLYALLRHAGTMARSLLRQTPLVSETALIKVDRKNGRATLNENGLEQSLYIDPKTGDIIEAGVDTETVLTASMRESAWIVRLETFSWTIGAGAAAIAFLTGTPALSALLIGLLSPVLFNAVIAVGFVLPHWNIVVVKIADGLYGKRAARARDRWELLGSSLVFNFLPSFLLPLALPRVTRNIHTLLHQRFNTNRPINRAFATVLPGQKRPPVPNDVLRTVWIEYFLYLLGQGTPVNDVLKGLKISEGNDPIITMLENILQKTAIKSHDVRGDIIKNLSGQLGDRYELYPGGFASIDITPKNVNKKTALLNFEETRPNVKRVLYFGNEFFKEENKTGNDLSVLDAAASLTERGKELFVFSADENPMGRHSSARKSTLWIGAGPTAVKRVLQQINDAVAAGKNEVTIRGAGIDQDRSQTISLDNWAEEAAMFFDVDGTILDKKTDSFETSKDVCDLFVSLLELKTQMGLISGNSRIEQMGRVTQWLIKAGADLRTQTDYVNGGATRVTYSQQGEATIHNASGNIPAGVIQIVSDVLKTMARNDFGLSGEERMNWRTWMNVMGGAGRLPDFGNIDFYPWTKVDFVPQVITADEVAAAKTAATPLALTWPFIEVRDGVQISLKLFPREVPTDVSLLWDRFFETLDDLKNIRSTSFQSMVDEIALATPVTMDGVEDPDWDMSRNGRMLWGEEKDGVFVKSPFRTAIERLMGVDDLIAAQRTPENPRHAEVLAKSAVMGIWQRLEARGLTYHDLTPEIFNKYFGVLPLVMGAGQATRFSRYIHKGLATNGLGRTNIAFSLDGASRPTGINPVVGVSEKILSEIMKAEHLEDYDDEKGIFRIKSDLRQQLIEQLLIRHDSPLLDQEKAERIFGRAVDIIFDPEPKGHGDLTIEMVRKLTEEKMITAPYVQILFAEAAEYALTEKSNPAFISYLKMLSGNHLAVAGGRTSHGKLEAKGHFFFDAGKLVAYTDWEQIPHLKKMGDHDKVHRLLDGKLKEVTEALAALRKSDAARPDKPKFLKAIKKLRRENPYFTISNDGYIFSQETIIEAQNKCEMWKDLSPDEKALLKRNFAVYEKPDGKADLLISANSAIFNADALLNIRDELEAQYDIFNYRAYDEKTGDTDRRIPTPYWRTDVKDGISNSIIWGVFNMFARRSLPDNKSLALVMVGDNAPVSIKDPGTQQIFSNAYRAAFPSVHHALDPPVTDDIANKAGYFIGLVKAREDTLAINYLFNLAFSDINTYSAFLHHVLKTTLTDKSQVQMIQAIANVDEALQKHKSLSLSASSMPRSPPSVIIGVHRQVIAEAIDRDELSPDVFHQIMTDWSYRNATIQLFSKLANNPKSGHVRAKMERTINKVLEEILKNQKFDVSGNSNGRPRVVSFNGGSAAVFMALSLRVAGLDRDLAPHERLVVNVLSHVDDGGATFNILAHLWRHGYGLLPPIGDQVNALFSSFATEDKLMHLLGNAGRVREKNDKSLTEVARRAIITTIFDSQIDSLSHDFYAFSADLIEALERVDEEFIAPGLLPIQGASLRNMYLLGKLLINSLLKKGEPQHGGNSITDPDAYHAVLNEIAERTGIIRGQVAPVTFDPSTIYTAHRAHSLFIQTSADDPDQIPIQSKGQTFHVRLITIEPVNEAGVVYAIEIDGKMEKKVHPLKKGDSLTIGRMKIGNNGRTPTIESGGNVYEFLEDKEKLTLRLVSNKGIEIEIARDGSGRAIENENISKSSGEPDWIRIGSNHILLRNRYIVMQTHTTETVNFSNIEQFGEVNQKVGLAPNQRFPTDLAVRKIPTSKANPRVISYLDSMKSGDVVIVGPGSIFTSLLPHFMVLGVPEALKAARLRGAHIIFVMNGTFDNETLNLSSLDILTFFAEKAGSPIEDFISGVIFAGPLPEGTPEEVVDRYIAHRDTGYETVFDAWILGKELSTEALQEWARRHPEVKTRLIERLTTFTGKLHGKKEVELRSDPSAASKSGKNAYGILSPSMAEILTLNHKGILTEVTPLLTLGTTIDRSTGKESYRVQHDPVLFGLALKRLLERLNNGEGKVLTPTGPPSYPGPNEVYDRLLEQYEGTGLTTERIGRIIDESEKGQGPSTDMRVNGDPSGNHFAFHVPHQHPLTYTYAMAKWIVPMLAQRVEPTDLHPFTTEEDLFNFLIQGVANAIDVGAKDIDVEVNGDDEWLRIEIIDSGPGFGNAKSDPSRQKWGGNGLFLTDLERIVAKRHAWRVEKENRVDENGNVTGAVLRVGIQMHGPMDERIAFRKRIQNILADKVHRGVNEMANTINQVLYETHMDLNVEDLVPDLNPKDHKGDVVLLFRNDEQLPKLVKEVERFKNVRSLTVLAANDALKATAEMAFDQLKIAAPSSFHVYRPSLIVNNKLQLSKLQLNLPPFVDRENLADVLLVLLEKMELQENGYYTPGWNFYTLKLLMADIFEVEAEVTTVRGRLVLQAIEQRLVGTQA